MSDRSSGGLSDWVFPGIFIAVGLALILFGLQRAERAHASSRWPKADGIIRLSAVRRSTNKNGISYQANLEYTYTVSGAPYSGDRVSFSQYGTGNAKHAQSIVDRYPSKRTVKVSFEPGHPELSVLETGLTFADSFLPLGGAAFLAAGYYLGRPPKRKDALADTSAHSA